MECKRCNADIPNGDSWDFYLNSEDEDDEASTYCGPKCLVISVSWLLDYDDMREVADDWSMWHGGITLA